MAQSQRYEISMWFQRLSVLTRRDFWAEVVTLQGVDYVVELIHVLQHIRQNPLQGRTETTFASEIEALVGEAGMRLRSNQYSPQSQTTAHRAETTLTNNATERSLYSPLGGVIL